jgi:type IV pilus assembly protein PilC
MRFFTTPGFLEGRAALYHQLSQLTAAGIALPAALELQYRSPPARSLRPALGIVLQQLEAGSTFSEALHHAQGSIPVFDIALLHAGEHSGRLPTCFSMLADHYENSARLLRRMLSSLMYPALLFHLAVMLAPFPELVRTWNIPLYLAKVLLVLLPVYAVLLAVGWAAHGHHGEQWIKRLESLLHRIPLLGKARRNLALARLASALEALVSAGVTIIEAWELAATASGSPALARAVHQWRPLLQTGTTPAEALRATREFPELFVNLYNTGEVTGSVDDSLRRLHVLYEEEGGRQMKAVAEWTPKLIYFGVVIVVAWQVISFWTGYFNSVGEAIPF